MPQYVIEIQVEENGIGVGWLAQSFEITKDTPIPSVVPDNRIQKILTNTQSFNEIVAIYEGYRWPAIKFSTTEEAETISCIGEYEHTWPIN